jgi:dipeptidyl-peptidase-4
MGHKISAALLAGSALLAAAPAAAQDLTLERIFASPSLSGPTPRRPELSPDGRLVTVLRNRADDRDRFDLWAIDASNGQARMLVDSARVGSGAALSEEEMMRRERARIAGTRGIVDYRWSPDGRSLLVPLDGDLFRATLDGQVQRLTQTEQTELDAEVSKTGRYISFVRDQNLFVIDGSGSERQLTTDGADAISWGVAEFVANEEMDRDVGHWWSPDDRFIAVARVDESNVRKVTRTAIGAEGTRVFEQRYPVAGSPNAVVDLFVMRPDGSGRVKVDLGPDQRHLSGARRTGRRTAASCSCSARAATKRSWTCCRSIPCRALAAAVQRDLADLGQPPQQSGAAQGRQPHLVVRAQRLPASLPLARRPLDPAHPRRLGSRRGEGGR